MSDDRLTLVVTTRPRAAWKRSHVLFVDTLARMHETLGALDVARIILDRCATAEEYLLLLARLPYDVAGDVLFVRENGGAFLSATSRGGDRVTYALNASDLHFYLETNGLTSGREQLALIA